MNIYTKLYSIALTVFLIIDAVWLAVVAKNFYAKHIGFLMTEKPNWWAAGVFYLINILGLVILVIFPGIEAKSLSKTLIFGALYGLVTYATYDLTNLATIKGWPVIVTIVDLIWGVTISTIVAGITFKLAN